MSKFWNGRDAIAQVSLSVVLLVQAGSLMAQLPSFKIPGTKKKPDAKAGPQFPAWTVKPEWVKAHEQFLASDALAGRGSATRDEEIAATYVVSEFMQYGLTPAPGSQGFLQSIDVVAPTLDGKASLAAGGVVLTEGDDMQVLYSTGTSVSGSLQRIPASEVGKTKGKKDAVVVLTGAPLSGETLQGVIGTLFKEGVGFVLVPKSEATQKFFDQIGGKTRVPVKLKDDESAAHGTTLASVSEAAMKGLDTVREGAKVTLTIHAEIKPRQTFNAIGFLAGSDPSSGTILLTAHLDHLGVGAAVNGDAIYNGANDDAAGTTAVLELAHVLAAGPKLKRSILFVCYGSEESGELGSEYFGKHPPVPLKDLVANLEFEMIGNQDPKMPPGTLLLTGFDRSNLGSTLKEHGAKVGPDPYPEQHFFERSDNYQLALEGVVAHTAAGWGTPLTYHQPNDDLAHLDINFMTAAIQSLIDPLRWLATNEFKPAWFPGMQPKR
ncbi:M28 family peptidase [Granulicella arctica]|uniref:M28 family peptidase n=1 Tax=Granulicella arctica TaxID=940613 RepID=UPI0021DFFEF3|nr:M28 family peptidase [Granulicella arctica]